jgi:hypothetical protein
MARSSGQQYPQPVLQTGMGAAAAIGGGMFGAWMQGVYTARKTRLCPLSL